MIAMALALEPSILVADEPTTALDVTTQAQIIKLIRDIQQRRGMAVMFITHDFGVVADIADRVAVMEKGKVVEQGRSRDVLERPQHPYTRRLLAAVPDLIPPVAPFGRGRADRLLGRRGWPRPIAAAARSARAARSRRPRTSASTSGAARRSAWSANPARAKARSAGS